MRINYLNSMTGSGTEAQTVMVNDIPEVNKVCLVLDTLQLYLASMYHGRKGFGVALQTIAFCALLWLQKTP